MRQTAKLRHDFRHSIRLLTSPTEQGDLDGILKHLAEYGAAPQSTAGKGRGLPPLPLPQKNMADWISWVQIREVGYTSIKNQVVYGFPWHWYRNKIFIGTSCKTHKKLKDTEKKVPIKICLF